MQAVVDICISLVKTSKASSNILIWEFNFPMASSSDFIKLDIDSIMQILCQMNGPPMLITEISIFMLQSHKE